VQQEVNLGRCDRDRLRKIDHQLPHRTNRLRQFDDRQGHPRAGFRAGWVFVRTSCVVSTGCRRASRFGLHLAREGPALPTAYAARNDRRQRGDVSPPALARSSCRSGIGAALPDDPLRLPRDRDTVKCDADKTVYIQLFDAERRDRCASWEANSTLLPFGQAAQARTRMNRALPSCLGSRRSAKPSPRHWGSDLPGPGLLSCPYEPCRALQEPSQGLPAGGPRPINRHGVGGDAVRSGAVRTE